MNSKKQIEIFREFLHDISNDVTIAEGFVKCGVSDLKKNGADFENERLDKGLERLTRVSKKLREFKELAR